MDKELLDKIDMNKVMLSVTIAFDLIKAGNEILEILKKGEEMDELQLLELIEKKDEAKREARGLLIEALKRAQAREASSN